MLVPNMIPIRLNLNGSHERQRRKGKCQNTHSVRKREIIRISFGIALNWVQNIPGTRFHKLRSQISQVPLCKNLKFLGGGLKGLITRSYHAEIRTYRIYWKIFKVHLTTSVILLRRYVRAKHIKNSSKFGILWPIRQYRACPWFP